VANEDTTQLEFYAPWPNIGKKFSEQLGEIRTDTAALAPIVRGFGLDASGDFTTLDAIESTAVQAIEIGEQDFHNRFRMHYNKTTDVFELASNTGTVEVPNWYTTWWIDKDGLVTQQNTPTTASNLASGDSIEGLFFQKSGVDLQFKSLRVFYPLTITSDNSLVTLRTGAQSNTYSDRVPNVSLGGPGDIISVRADTGKQGVDFPFKSMEAGPNMTISSASDGDTVVFQSTAQVVEFYGIVVQHSNGTAVFPGVHILKVNRDSFYLTKQARSAEVLLNSRGDVLKKDDFVAVIGDDMTGQLLMFDGTAAAPSIAFTNETDTGLRRRAVNDFAFVTSGVDRLRIQDSLIFGTVPFHAADSTVALPGYTFSSDPNTGLFQEIPGDDSLSITAGGLVVGKFSDAGFDAGRVTAGVGEFYVQVLGHNKTVLTRPAFSFRDDTDTGMYRFNPDAVGLVTGGVLGLRVTNTQDVVITNEIRAGDGGVGNPAYSFDASGQTDVGMYRSATDELSFATGGIRGFMVDSGQHVRIIQGTPELPSIAFIDDPDTGMYLSGTSNNIIRFSTEGIYTFSIQPTGIFPTVPIKFNFTDAKVTPTVSNPAYGFNPDTNTGIYQNASDDDSVAFSTGGVRAGYFDSNQDLYVTNEIKAGDGAVGGPAYSFSASGQTDVGMYRSGTDEISFATGGVQALKIDSAQNVTVLGELKVADGTASLPSLTFTSDTNTGIYSVSQNVLGFAVGGIKRGELNNNGDWTITRNLIAVDGKLTGKVLVSDGTAGAPTFAFTDDSNTGMYSVSQNVLGFTVGGTQRGDIDNSGNLTMTGGVTSTTVTVDDEAYTAAGWDGDLTVPTKNAVRDKIESMGSGSGGTAGQTTNFYGGIDVDGSGVFSGIVRGEAFYIGTHNSGLSTDKNGRMSLNAGPNTIDINTSAGGDVFINTPTGGSDGIFIQAGSGGLLLQTSNAGLLDIDSDGFINITAPSRIAIQSENQDIRLRASSEVSANAPIRGDQNSGVSTPAYSFLTDTDLGMYRRSVNSLGFATVGIEAGYFDNVQNFYIRSGIVAASLEIAGTSLLKGNLVLGTAASPVPNFQIVVHANDEPSIPPFTFHKNRDTGMYIAEPSQLAFTVDGTKVGHFYTNFHVLNDVHAGRVEAGLGVFYTSLTVADEAYTDTGWDGDLTVPTKNAVRDKIESMVVSGGGQGTNEFYGGIIVEGIVRAEAFYLGKHNSGLSTSRLGHMLLSSGPNDLLLHAFGDGDINLDTTDNTGDINIQSGSGGMLFQTLNAGLIDLDSDGFMTMTANKDMTLEVTDASRVIKVVPTLEFRVDAAPIRAEQNQTVSAPAYSFTSDTDTGMYRKGTNQLAFGTKGTEAGYFDAAQNLFVTNDITAGKIVRAEAFYLAQNAGLSIDSGGNLLIDSGANNVHIIPNTELEVVGDVFSKGLSWTLITGTPTVGWNGVTYGNGLFVAVTSVGTGDRVATSPDGINWTLRTSAADNGWIDIIYGNGLFVAVSFSGTGNRVMTSPDGIIWTSRTSAADNSWRSVTYGNGLFVAVAITGSGNRVMTSSDGITWTSRTSAEDNDWFSVTYGNGLFVAVSNDGTGNRVMTSSDGITWTIRTSAADNGWVDVTYGHGLFVAIANTGSGNRVMTSPDGITWTIRTSAADNNWIDIIYGSGLFVAVANTGSGNRVMTSSDGITWTSRTSAEDNEWVDVTYGNGLFVAVANAGTNDKVMTSGKTELNEISTDNILQGGLEVRNDLIVVGDMNSSRVEAGIGNFYLHLVDTLVRGSISQIQGTRNLIIGENAGSGGLGDDSVFLGYNAGNDNTSTGHRNTFIGSGAGELTTSADDNVFIGYNAGAANIIKLRVPCICDIDPLTNVSTKCR